MPYLDIPCKKTSPDAILPSYQNPGDAGFDFHCLEDVAIPPHSVSPIRTGLSFAIPEGYELQVRLRSGVALRSPLILANAPGTIDSGYRGEIKLLLRNLGDEPYFIKKGERLAQGIIAPVFQASFREVAELPDSQRGAGGFGSTGKN